MRIPAELNADSEDAERGFPTRVNVETSEGDAFERLSAILNDFRRDRAQMPKHVNELVRELKNEGAISAERVAGRRFGAVANPLLRVAKEKR